MPLFPARIAKKRLFRHPATCDSITFPFRTNSISTSPHHFVFVAPLPTNSPAGARRILLQVMDCPAPSSTQFPELAFHVGYAQYILPHLHTRSAQQDLSTINAFESSRIAHASCRPSAPMHISPTCFTFTARTYYLYGYQRTRSTSRIQITHEAPINHHKSVNLSQPHHHSLNFSATSALLRPFHLHQPLERLIT